MSSANKKRIIFSSVSVDLGCSSCKKPILSYIFHPKSKSKSKSKPKPKPRPKTATSSAVSSAYHHLYYSSSISSKTNPSPPDYDSFSSTTGTTAHLWDDHNGRKLRGFGRVGGDGVAVEKDSDDPYLDFRHSMLQMILENEIYSKDDLKELLNCFLQLNSPYYHGIIVRAFTEIWDGVFSVKSPTACGGGGFSDGSQQKLHY